MAETRATLGYGLIFAVGSPSASPTTFIPLLEVYDIPEIGADAELREATHHASPDGYREWIAGLKDGSEFELLANLIWDTTQQNIKTVFDNEERPTIRLTTSVDSATPLNIIAEFTVIVIGWAFLPPIDDRQSLRARFKISGSIIIT